MPSNMDSRAQVNVHGRIIRQSGFYALGNLSLKVGGLVLAVLYLNPDYLSVGEFGYFSLLILAANLGTLVIGLGMDVAMMKLLSDTSWRSRHDLIPMTTLVATTTTALMCGAAVAILAKPLAALLLDDGSRVVPVYLLAAYLTFAVVLRVPMMILRVNERAGQYVSAVVANLVILLVAAYVFLVVLELRLEGLMGAYAVSTILTAAIMVGVTMTRIRWRIDMRVVRELLNYGSPLIVASAAVWVLAAGDRYLLKWLTDPPTVGLYEWASRLAGILNLLFVQSLNLAFSVIGLKVLGSSSVGERIHERTVHHYIFWTGWVALALATFASDVTRLLPADPVYLEADVLVAVLAIGFLNYGIYAIVVNVSYASGRTTSISGTVALSAALNVALNLILIPSLGAFGAALATAVAYLALAWGALVQARRDRPIRFPVRAYVTVVALVIGLFVLGRVCSGWPYGACLAFRIAATGLYGLAAIALRVYRWTDLRSVVLLAVEQFSTSRR